MKTHYLFPYQFKKIGWILLVAGIILGVLHLIVWDDLEFLDIKVFAIVHEDFLDVRSTFTFAEVNILNEIAGLLLIVGGLFVAFSREKSEDEFIARIRLESLVWATYINFAILILTIIFVYGVPFLWVLVFNMFTILVFFIIRFNWLKYKSKKLLQNEE